MSTGFCVESPCQVLGINGPGFCKAEWCDIKENPANINGIYSTLYVLGYNAPAIVGDIPDMIRNNATELLYKLNFLSALPYVLTFIALFIALMYSSVITIDVGLLLIGFVIFVTFICISWLFNDVSAASNTITDNIQTTLTNNLEAVAPTMALQLLAAFTGSEEIQCYQC